MKDYDRTQMLTNMSTAPQLGYCSDQSPEGIVDALRTDGCALIPSVVPVAEAARLGIELASYEPGGTVANEGLMRSDPIRSAMARPAQGDLPYGEHLCSIGQRKEALADSKT